MNVRIESCLSEWLQWPVEQQPHVIRQFDCGMNHEVVLLQAGSEQWVLKCFDGKPQPAVAAQRWASTLNIAPNIAFYSATQRYCVMDVCQSADTSDSGIEASQLTAIAHSLSALHQSNPAELTRILGADSLRFDLNQWIRTYIERIQGIVDARLFSTISNVQQQLAPVLQQFTHDKTASCPCHNDLVTENCFAYDTQALFIDWEFAQLNNPWFDLASVIYYFRLSDQQAEQFLKSYTGNTPLPNRTKNICLQAQCAVAWLDLLWYVDKLGQDEWPKQSAKLSNLQALCAKLDTVLEL